MFTDHITLTISSGKGAPGCVAFRREKFVLNGGPNGGDGGRGGDVWFECDNNTHTLASLQGKRLLKAEDGKPGMGSRMTGKSGDKLIIKVPPGTQVKDLETDEVICDMLEHGQTQKVLVGGKGGLGNFHFKSSTNQRPTYAQPGEPAVTKKVKLDLKMIADVGLVGFPNVGKSTLISTVSNARPEVADYEFTTLTPKLGQVNIGDYDSFVMADIPGIIGGASEGKGLGLRFLRHIERTKTLLFMIDLASYHDINEQFETLKGELKTFSEKLSNQAYAIALTRVDAMYGDDRDEKIKSFIENLELELSEDSKYKFDSSMPFYEQRIGADDKVDLSKPYFIAPISSVMHTNIDAVKFALHDLIVRER